MRIFCFSSDINLLNRWENILNKSYEVILIEDETLLASIENSIFIFSSCSKLNQKQILDLKKRENKILVLERVPNLSNAKIYLSLKIDGYGNSIMSEPYLIAAVKAIMENHIFLLPKIATELFRDISDYKIGDSKNSILDTLTKSEKKVAYLLKDGYKNQEICDELNISINTVKKHIKSIYEKLNIQDRATFMKLFLVNN